MAYGPAPEPFESKYARFTERVPFCGCHIWMGEVDKNGYGKTRSNGKRVMAHRESYKHFVGQIVDGNVIMHSCDTPSCVNPNHLSQGTHQDNSDDMVAKKGMLSEFDLMWQPSMMLRRLIYLTLAVSNPTLQKKFDVSQSTVSMIKRKLYWKHIHEGMI